MNTMTCRIIPIIISLLFSLNVHADDMKMPPGHAAMQAAGPNRIHGKVVEAMDVNNYTYVQVNTGSKTYWAAGPKTVLRKGDMIAFDTGMPFTDFESKSLKKKFDTIYFVNQFLTDQPGQAIPMTDPHAGIKQAGKEKTIKGIKKAKGGKTVAEVFKNKTALSGKAVRVRGQVVKYTAKVMGKNWLHIQDSSGTQKLVVTTDQEVKKGDRVLVDGVVAINRDLGYGYTYEVLIEKARVSVE